MSYTRFAAMIVTATVVMYGLMYSTAYAVDHVWWSQTRFWMALYMGGVMAIIMLAFMLKMYTNQKKNIAIFVGSAVLIVASLFLARSQTTVDDVSWMKAMIPHHSIAVLTSERAEISDPRVRRLADAIIHAQRLEIAEMEALIRDVEDLDLDREPMPPTVPPIAGGSEDVPNAPSLRVGAAYPTQGVVMIAEGRVASDAWIVLHPAAASGGPDASAIVGRAFLRHGVTENVPVRYEASLIQGDTLYAMLHDDTGAIGTFEFGGAGTPDQPLTTAGGPVTQPVALQ